MPGPNIWLDRGHINEVKFNVRLLYGARMCQTQVLAGRLISSGLSRLQELNLGVGRRLENNKAC